MKKGEIRLIVQVDDHNNKSLEIEIDASVNKEELVKFASKGLSQFCKQTTWIQNDK